MAPTLPKCEKAMSLNVRIYPEEGLKQRDDKEDYEEIIGSSRRSLLSESVRSD